MGCACGRAPGTRQEFIVTDKLGQQKTFNNLAEARAYANRNGGAVQTKTLQRA